MALAGRRNALTERAFRNASRNALVGTRHLRGATPGRYSIARKSRVDRIDYEIESIESNAREIESIESSTSRNRSNRNKSSVSENALLCVSLRPRAPSPPDSGPARKITQFHPGVVRNGALRAAFRPKTRSRSLLDALVAGFRPAKRNDAVSRRSRPNRGPLSRRDACVLENLKT